MTQASIFIPHCILWIILEAPPHSPTLTSLDLRHSSFSNPFAALPTSHLILLPFRCFPYIVGTSPTSQRILLPFRRFTYVTTHSPTLPLLHLDHSSCSNHSFASPTSQNFHLLYVTWRTAHATKDNLKVNFRELTENTSKLRTVDTLNYCTVFVRLIFGWLHGTGAGGSRNN